MVLQLSKCMLELEFVCLRQFVAALEPSRSAEALSGTVLPQVSLPVLSSAVVHLYAPAGRPSGAPEQAVPPTERYTSSRSRSDTSS
jgi:hypothetical protein